jgi:hypothetical protein
VVGLTIAVLLIDLSGRQRFKFINPGPLSAHHSQRRGGAGTNAAEPENCAACHGSAANGFPHWIEAAISAKPGPGDFIASTQPASFHPKAMDRKCQECHRGRDFHHAQLERSISCLSCHDEHSGDAGLLQFASARCAKCHGSAGQMAAFNGASPRAGRIPGLVTGFSKDHPEFALLASKSRDSNTLRFNHERHLSAEVVAPRGGQLKCAACHEQDAAGAYHRPMNFERHCQSCHALQFDPANPQLQLPHGQPGFVQAFLASLPEQYERHGREYHQITERRALASFVQSQMRRMEEAQIGGETLAQRIFFNSDRRVPTTRAGTVTAQGVSPFYGCAYCHDVTGSTANPVVAHPSIPARWLARGTFHHRSHEGVSCSTCHQVAQSQSSSDVLLPSISTCAACHNPKSSPGESCVLCHDFHRARPKL